MNINIFNMLQGTPPTGPRTPEGTGTRGDRTPETPIEDHYVKPRDVLKRPSTPPEPYPEVRRPTNSPPSMTANLEKAIRRPYSPPSMTANLEKVSCNILTYLF